MKQTSMLFRNDPVVMRLSGEIVGGIKATRKYAIMTDDRIALENVNRVLARKKR